MKERTNHQQSQSEDSGNQTLKRKQESEEKEEKYMQIYTKIKKT